MTSRMELGDITMSYPISSQPQAMQGYAASGSQWHSEVFDCCEDMGVCLCGAFVPCILACKVATDYGECCCLPFIGGALLAMRTGIRERYHIPGSICNDCVCLTFCGPCTLCQMARELKQRKC
ncbi:cornifelin homolog B-like isoform X2 [Hyla sarda]|uniref:cornifelin homolog B-like isoform X2 n=1 Tax=Hyla sarda TaxID=327740 RepID=UPI0024C30FB1|nr:cornifelin homolog B-like isoform X2 [Hyla sarda]